MIKFFRHIRQRMIKENVVSKYLLYAIGEIVLVVIGILIALQLNNWNGEQKRAKQEIDLLVEMRENLSNDLVDCQYNIGMNKRLLLGNEMVLKHLTERTPFHDSLRLHYAQLFGGTQLTANTSAFDNLKSTGFDLIQNDSLRRNITKLYSERYTYVHSQEVDLTVKMHLDNLKHVIHGKVVVDKLWKSAYPLDVAVLYEDEVFKSVVRMNVFMFHFMITIYSSVEKRIDGLIEQINKELEDRQTTMNWGKDHGEVQLSIKGN